jgi:hypothetical protein
MYAMSTYYPVYSFDLITLVVLIEVGVSLMSFFIYLLRCFVDGRRYAGSVMGLCQLVGLAPLGVYVAFFALTYPWSQPFATVILNGSLLSHFFFLFEFFHPSA